MESLIDPAHLGPRVRELRILAGLAQKTLAEKSSMSTGTLALIEAGKVSPSWDKVVALANALGVGVDEFTRPPSGDELPSLAGRPRKVKE